MEMNFCRRCGAALKPQAEAGFLCTNGHQMFENAAPAQSVFLIKDRRALLAERGIDPGRGKLAFPGGFCEAHENFEETTARELREELGLEPDDYGPLHYLGSHNEPYRFGGETRPVLGVIYWAELKNEQAVQPGDDLAGHFEFVTADVSRERLAFEGMDFGLRRLKELDVID